MLQGLPKRELAALASNRDVGITVNKPFPAGAKSSLHAAAAVSEGEEEKLSLCVCVCVRASTAFELDFGVSWTVAVPDLQHPGNSIQF